MFTSNNSSDWPECLRSTFLRSLNISRVTYFLNSRSAFYQTRRELLTHLNQLLSLVANVATVESLRSVTMVALLMNNKRILSISESNKRPKNQHQKSSGTYIQEDRHINVDNVAILQRTRVGNAMADALVHRSANTLGKTSVAKWRWIRTGIDDHLMHSPVDLIRRHTWLCHSTACWISDDFLT